MTGYCDSKDNKFLPQITAYHNELKNNQRIDQYFCKTAQSDLFFLAFEDASQCAIASELLPFLQPIAKAGGQKLYFLWVGPKLQQAYPMMPQALTIKKAFPPGMILAQNKHIDPHYISFPQKAPASYPVSKQKPIKFQQTAIESNRIEICDSDQENDEEQLSISSN